MIVGAMILFIYAVFVLWLIWGIVKTQTFQIERSFKPQTTFSIIIPFKNEVQNLGALYHSLQKLDYPNDLFEVLMINDHSTDASTDMVRRFNEVKLLTNTGQGKKKALQTGILQSKFSWIVTTDADTVLPENWLKILDAFIQQYKPKMVLGLVNFFDDSRFITQFQQIEFLILQALTMAGLKAGKPFLANGANLAFTKEVFEQVGGYKGNAHIASGDDVFLLEKIHRKYPDKICFLKSQQAIVQTHAMSSWRHLWQQKIRWAAKTKHIKNTLAWLSGLLILSVQLTVLWAFWHYKPYAWFIAGKLFLDALLLVVVNRFYKARIHPIYFILSFLWYPFYFIVTALGAYRGKYIWKGQSY